MTTVLSFLSDFNMKKIFSLLVLFAILSFISTEKANAKITFGTHEKIEKIYDLPNNDDYKSNDGKYIDLGYKYSVFEIAFLPLYQEGEGEIVGFHDNTYYELTKEQLDGIVKENNIENVESLAKLPFWDAWGGKLAALVVIGLVIFGLIGGRKKEVQA